MISYQCKPGFIPEGRVISVCGGDGRWNPDPDQYSCREGMNISEIFFTLLCDCLFCLPSYHVYEHT